MIALTLVFFTVFLPVLGILSLMWLDYLADKVEEDSEK